MVLLDYYKALFMRSIQQLVGTWSAVSFVAIV